MTHDEYDDLFSKVKCMINVLIERFQNHITAVASNKVYCDNGFGDTSENGNNKAKTILDMTIGRRAENKQYLVNKVETEEGFDAVTQGSAIGIIDFKEL